MKKIAFVFCALALASCSSRSLSDSMLTTDAKVADLTHTDEMLMALPAARQKIPVSVYDFQDQTGQHKPDDNFAQYSRAVTQGGLSILMKGLLDTANGKFFTVIERGGLQNLLQERQIIRTTRDQYHLPNGQKLPNLPPLLYAGMLLEGGIVSYESNVLTGGAGANYLGIGADVQYRQDIVTVYLRAISVKTGEVLLSVNTSKTIFSSGVQGNAYRYVTFDKIFQFEAGYTANEPPQFAVRQAIEMAVYSLIMEGARKDLWSFADPAAGQELVTQYIKNRDSDSTPEQEWKRKQAMQPEKPVAKPQPQQSQETAPSAPITRTQQPPALPQQQVQPTPQVQETSEMPRGETPAESISAPTGNLEPTVTTKDIRDPSLLSPEQQMRTETLHQGAPDQLYCGTGGCYPFKPPAGSTPMDNGTVK